MPTCLSFVAPAKVNLYLHVTGRRENGYHLLDSLVVFARDVRDELTLEPAERYSLHIEGPFGKKLFGGDDTNLVTQAVNAFIHETGFQTQVKITLTKNLPLGGGIGGGSSDAARTFKALEQFSGIDIPAARRDEILLKLGADVPVCYRDNPCRFQGIGEIITDAPKLPRFYIVLIWPNAHAVTKEIFSARPQTYNDAPLELPSGFDGVSALIDFLCDHTRNDLEETAATLFPAIRTAKEFLQTQNGCRLARMSGSGASVFGMFESKAEADAACAKALENQGWWAVSSAI